MTTTTPAPALEGAALLLHLVDRCERGVALAEEYTLLRAGIRQLDGENGQMRDEMARVRNLWAREVRGSARLRAELAQDRNSLATRRAISSDQREENARLQAKVRDLEAHLAIAHQNVRAMRDGGVA